VLCVAGINIGGLQRAVARWGLRRWFFAHRSQWRAIEIVPEEG
jgi:hypothetical protein